MRAVIARDKQGQGADDDVRQGLMGLGLQCDPADCVAYADLGARLAQGAVDLILVRVAPGAAAAQAAIRQALQLARARSWLTGRCRTRTTSLGSDAAGHGNTWTRKTCASDLEAALGRLRLANEIDFGQGTVVTVAGATPGCGVTTLSTNLAFAWAQAQPGRVVLVEFGRPPADLAVNLDLAPHHAVTAVCARWQTLDVALVRQALVEHAGGVSVLAHVPETLHGAAIEPKAVHPLLVLLRSQFATTVLDLGHLLEGEHFEAMRQGDQVIVVVRLDVPGLRQTRRLLREMRDQGIARDRIQLVVNRYGQAGQVPWRQAEETLGASFLEYIPDDCGLANEALNHGQPLVLSAPRSRISRTLTRLAEQLVEQRSRPAGKVP